jgi:hypothetical protein
MNSCASTRRSRIRRSALGTNISRVVGLSETVIEQIERPLIHEVTIALEWRCPTLPAFPRRIPAQQTAS